MFIENTVASDVFGLNFLRFLYLLFIYPTIFWAPIRNNTSLKYVLAHNVTLLKKPRIDRGETYN